MKCALKEELKQMTRDYYLEYRQQQTDWFLAKIEYFRQCIGFQQKFDIPPGAFQPAYMEPDIRFLEGG